jgi:hypothetical protein
MARRVWTVPAAAYKRKISNLCTYFRYLGSPSTESHIKLRIRRYQDVDVGCVWLAFASATDTEPEFLELFSLTEDSSDAAAGLISVGVAILDDSVRGQRETISRHTTNTEFVAIT